MQRIFTVLMAACFYISNFTYSHAVETTDQITSAMKRAGSNRSQIQIALDNAPAVQKAGMEFLVAHMPDEDLQNLSADYLLKNLELAYQAWDEAPWKNDVPESLFLNNVLPYANINEQRDSWRADFYKRCKPLIAGAKTPAEAAVLLNQKTFQRAERPNTRQNAIGLTKVHLNPSAPDLPPARVCPFFSLMHADRLGSQHALWEHHYGPTRVATTPG